MYYESGMFPILFTDDRNDSDQKDQEAPKQTGGETPPPPTDPPKV